MSSSSASGAKAKSPKWAKERQLGEKGKEGAVYLVGKQHRRSFVVIGGRAHPSRFSHQPAPCLQVRDGGKGPMYAMKEFKATKSAAKVAKEADFQAQAAAVDAAPAVVAVPGGKPPSIVMECMDRTAVEVCRAQGGSLTDAQQWKILALYEALDGIRVLHNDANPLNLMSRRAPGAAAATAAAGADEEHEQWRLIDYGFAKKQTPKHRENPNLNMSLKLLLRSTMGLMTRGALTAPPAILLAALEQESHRPTGVGAPPPTAAIVLAGGSSSSSEAEEEAEDEEKEMEVEAVEVQPRRRRAGAKKPAAAGTKRGAPQRRSGRSTAAGAGTGASAAAAAAPTPKRTSKRLRAAATAGVLGEVSANVMAQQGGEGGGAAALASEADVDSDTGGRPYTARGVVRGVVTAAAAIGFAAMGGLF